jgi:hypothetical protein
VLLAYGLTAIVFFALPLLLTHGDQYFGVGADPRLFIWSFAWWPHAVLHGENPFYTHAVWTPVGQNLMWMTSVPGLALLFAPLTVLAGPFAAYNAASCVLPAIGAYAGFELCYYASRRFVPAVVGGYLFGFSSYVLGEALNGHLMVDTVFVVPLVALIVLRFLDGGIGRRAFSLWLGVLVAAELLISTELAFTLTLALVVGLLLTWVCVPERRGRISAILGPCGVGYGVAAVITAPFLYFLLGGFHEQAFWTSPHAADLLNVVVPPNFDLLAGSWMRRLSEGYSSLSNDQETFVGLVSIVVVVDMTRRGGAAGRMIGASFLVAFVCVLGPRLQVYGHSIVSIPWALVRHLPLFNNALPERVAVYISLISAVAVSLWLARRPHSRARVVIAVLAVLSVVPDPLGSSWTSGYSIPAFFTASAYRQCLDPGETVLALPTTIGTSLLWQAASDFRFKLAGGDAIGSVFIPSAYTSTAGDDYVTLGSHLDSSRTGILKSYVASKGITSAVVDGNEINFFSGALDNLATPESAGGVVLYHFTKTPPSGPAN